MASQARQLNEDTVPAGELRMVFLDAEFNLSRAGPELISIGLVSGEYEFYGQIDAEVIARRPKVKRNKFLLTYVLPQLLALPEASATAEMLSEQVVAWLNSLPGEGVNVAYDFNVDYSMFEQLVSPVTPKLNKRLFPCHVGYLLDDKDGIAAAEAAWSRTRERSLHRHHALADAIALQARFNAVHNT